MTSCARNRRRGSSPTAAGGRRPEPRSSNAPPRPHDSSTISDRSASLSRYPRRRPHGVEDLRGARRDGQHEDGGIGHRLEHERRGLHARHARHVDVHHDHTGRESRARRSRPVRSQHPPIRSPLPPRGRATPSERDRSRPRSEPSRESAHPCPHRPSRPRNPSIAGDSRNPDVRPVSSSGMNALRSALLAARSLPRERARVVELGKVGRAAWVALMSAGAGHRLTAEVPSSRCSGVLVGGHSWDVNFLVAAHRGRPGVKSAVRSFWRCRRTGFVWQKASRRAAFRCGGAVPVTGGSGSSAGRLCLMRP